MPLPTHRLVRQFLQRDSRLHEIPVLVRRVVDAEGPVEGVPLERRLVVMPGREDLASQELWFGSCICFLGSRWWR
jgi:hypothetical protein